MRQPVVELTVGSDETDAGSAVLWANGATAIEERSGSDGRTVLVADAEPSGVERAVAGRWRMVVVLVDPASALDAWRPYAQVVRAGRGIVVRPPWVPLPVDHAGADDLVIEIDPEQAFGSGSHPSTRLALAAIETLGAALVGSAVLDVGCGSGVLAVAAARLGAAKVVAIDVDPAAVPATAANAGRNGVTDVVSPANATLAGMAGPFDLVLFNISRAMSIELAPAVTSLVRLGGRVIIAGFLAADTEEVSAAYPSMIAEAKYEDVGWGGVVMRATRAGGAAPPSR